MSSGSLQREQEYMRMALRLAARGRGRTRPNPMVGAVVVKNNRVVGRGYHHRAGEEHAEILAIMQAGAKARGAQLFVNLEPCCHHGKTGPCVRAIIEAGIRSVVIGMQDPNPLVNGKGLRALRRAGVSTVTGVLEEQCRQLNAAFCRYIADGRPLVTFKAAITLDGRVAARGGDSRWVTGEAARREGHRLRDTHDAIMVGVGTILADDPRLTCRHVRGGRDPVRVVVDSRLRTPASARVVAAATNSRAPTWILTTARASKTRAHTLERAGASVLRVSGDARGGVDIQSMLGLLAEREITSLLLEGGPRLAGSFWRAGLVDRVVAFVAPKLLADPEALPMLIAGPARYMAEATRLTNLRIRRIGEDLMLTGIPLSAGEGR